mgnify:CR=1 FL=1
MADSIPHDDIARVVRAAFPSAPRVCAIAPLVVAYHLAFLVRAPDHRSRVHVRAALAGAVAGWRGVLGPV